MAANFPRSHLHMHGDCNPRCSLLFAHAQCGRSHAVDGIVGKLHFCLERCRIRMGSLTVDTRRGANSQSDPQLQETDKEQPCLAV